ncbi:MAG: hypothetical protein ACQERU_06785 [Bacteroidota bacterium]
MKRIIVAVVLSLFIVAVLSSCKGQDCPAYSQADVEQTDIAV